MKLYKILTLVILCYVVACADTTRSGNKSTTAQAARPGNYIINCKLSCEQAVKAVKQTGGHIRQRYRNFNLLAVELNTDTITNNELFSQYRFVKDKMIKAPQPVEVHSFTNKIQSMKKSSAAIQGVSAVTTKNFSSAELQTGVSDAHEDNILGQDIIVAIIDSGTANNSAIVPLLADKVIGGENFVAQDLEPSATSTANDAHGTWVGTVIAAQGSVFMDKSDPLAVALASHAPNSFSNLSDTQIEVPITGVAPAAKLYPLKVFPADGAGAPASRVIAAMDRVVTLKKNYNNGLPSEPVQGDGSEENPYVYESLNIQVVNMSLGGPSLFPGNEIDDLITDQMLQAGVVIVVAAGNEGFAAMTGGSPGTGIGALAVGASNDAIHERIYRDVNLGDGVGIKFRPTTTPQIAAFSSRGPTADGRKGVDLVANGRAVLVQGANGDIRLVSGTSFSAPAIAGAAALLWSQFPVVEAINIKSALVEGANRHYFSTAFTDYDRGHGLLNVDESLEILEQGNVQNHLPTKPLAEANSRVVDNLLQQGIPVFTLAEAEYDTGITLSPGQVQQIFVEIDESIHDVVIEIDDFVAQLPSDQQNSLFGDEFILQVADGILSVDHIVLQELIQGPQTYTITHPQPGLLRVAVLGDWTNAGLVSAEISVKRIAQSSPLPALVGTVADGETQIFTVDVDSTTTTLIFELNWKNNWAYYPAHDLDLIVVDPLGNPYFDGASLHSPEKLSIDVPEPGTWTVHVDGYLLHGASEEFRLSILNQNSQILSMTRH